MIKLKKLFSISISWITLILITFILVNDQKFKSFDQLARNQVHAQEKRLKNIDRRSANLMGDEFNSLKALNDVLKNK